MTTISTRPELVALEIGDPPEAWESLGFSVSPDRAIELGRVRLQLGADGDGIVSWTLRGIDQTSSIDGLPTNVMEPHHRRPIDQSVGTGDEDVAGQPTAAGSGASPASGSGASDASGSGASHASGSGASHASGSGANHANGALAVDHVVILTPDFDRTAAAVAAAGMPLRREAERNGARQGFRRLGPAIMEIVQAPDGPTRFWGLVVIVSDLDALAERLGDLLRGIRPAVQPGRRIAPLRSKAGLGPAVAFMDPS